MHSVTIVENTGQTMLLKILHSSFGDFLRDIPNWNRKLETKAIKAKINKYFKSKNGFSLDLQVSKKKKCIPK